MTSYSIYETYERFWVYPVHFFKHLTNLSWEQKILINLWCLIVIYRHPPAWLSTVSQTISFSFATSILLHWCNMWLVLYYSIRVVQPEFGLQWGFTQYITAAQLLLFSLFGTTNNSIRYAYNFLVCLSLCPVVRLQIVYCTMIW